MGVEMKAKQVLGQCLKGEYFVIDIKIIDQLLG